MSDAPAPLSRRGFLLRAAAVTAAAAAVPYSQALASPAYAAEPRDYTFPKAVREGVARAEARNKRLLAGADSANGWDMETAADQGGSIATRPVPGTPVTDLQIRLGAPETVLVHLVRRFHYEIAELQPGEAVGWTAPKGCAGPPATWPPAPPSVSGPATTRPAPRAATSPWNSRSCATSSPNSTVWSAGAATTAPSTRPSSTSPSAPTTSA